MKYLVGMLNNLEKMPNMTINCWVDYIRTNFFFDIVYKKENIFGPDMLSRMKWYFGNSSLDRLKICLNNEKDDVLILLGECQEKIPLKLEEFYENINLWEDFSIKSL